MQHALVVGASRGLGAGLAGELVGRGWHVTATERTPSDALAGLRTAHPDCVSVVSGIDITSPDAVQRLASAVSGARFDLLFLNAGIMAGRTQTVGAVADDEVVRIFMTNAIAPIRAADALAARVADGGTIAFMSSILGTVGGNEGGGLELYRSSKAALNSLVRSFRARQAASRKLTVLAVHPGVVQTDMGGASAPLDIPTSVRGLADMLAARAGSGGDAFVDYRNAIIPW